MPESGEAVREVWRTDSEQDVAAVLARIRDCLRRIRTCTLGTVGAETEAPVLTPCFFAPLNDLRVVILSSPSSRHARNVERNALASLSISSPAESFGDRLLSVQMTGRAQRAAGFERARLLAAYARRFANGAPGLLGMNPRGLREKGVYVLEPASVVFFDTEFSPRAVALWLDAPWHDAGAPHRPRS